MNTKQEIMQRYSALCREGNLEVAAKVLEFLIWGDLEVYVALDPVGYRAIEAVDDIDGVYHDIFRHGTRSYISY